MPDPTPLFTRWEAFEQAFIHPEAGIEQRAEMWKAFYGGAWAFWDTMSADPDTAREHTDAALGELHLFWAAMKAETENTTWAEGSA